jgi:hypothetical protein
MATSSATKTPQSPKGRTAGKSGMIRVTETTHRKLTRLCKIQGWTRGLAVDRLVTAALADLGAARGGSKFPTARRTPSPIATIPDPEAATASPSLHVAPGSPAA